MNLHFPTNDDCMSFFERYGIALLLLIPIWIVAIFSINSVLRHIPINMCSLTEINAGVRVRLNGDDYEVSRAVYYSGLKQVEINFK